MTRWRLFAIGLAIYALALIVTAPATLVDAGLRNASDGKLRVTQAQGTLWSGTGQLDIRDADGRTGVVKHVSWRLRPGALLRAHLTYEIELDPGTRPFPLTISWSRIELGNANISLPAAALVYDLPTLAALGITGDVSIQVSSLSIGRHDTRGRATLQWRTASSALSPISPLGDYELRLDGDGHVVRASLHTLRGPLQLDGQGAWPSGTKPAFLATAHIPQAFQQRLAPFLRLIAVESADGSFAWQLK